MKNALTFDLEDYFHVGAFADQIQEDHWNSYESRVQANTDTILQLLEDHHCKATFFVLGWVAEKQPQLVKRIAEMGHEIACHSNRHRRVYELTPQEFREDTLRAKNVLEDACGRPVRGYRAPSFSIGSNSLWAFEVLTELGFTYDSSIFPVRHPNYGMPHAPRFPFLIRSSKGDLLEFPMPTLALAGHRSPLGGGAYLRLLPYWYTKWGIRFINQQEEQPACVYLHPWELDARQPRMNGSASAHLRHYKGLRGTEGKLRRLLADFEFVPLGEFVTDSRGLECSMVLNGSPKKNSD
jgi:polysaccharide deacetylase family protein (PEP-CTERM system associated)